MSDANKFSDKSIMKIRLYRAAVFLFEKGKSHPQIVTLLLEYEPNYKIIIDLVDKAMHDEWYELSTQAKNLFAKGMTYDNVLNFILNKEPDKEIAKWICDDWYNLKSQLADCIIDGSSNRLEGMKWIIICALGIPIFFYIGSSWFVKGIWILALVGSIIQYIVGHKQKIIQTSIQQIFSIDIQNSTVNAERN